ncbi:hypothetical protein ACH4TV_26575 [Streptomyces sp. NPDC020898]|uniref:hypothetical protein n=1 Tax=Streptomyces sp. NPDC020898 TaxID=3365101 RepID=UPI0037982FB9
MADDDRYGWLDRATAESLLSGEPLELSPAFTDPEARDQAERLAKTLGALSVDLPLSNAELPGEAAALAAFRMSRPATDTTLTASPAPVPSSTDMGLVRVGGAGRSGAARRTGFRPARWGRPMRLGLGAALAAGMVGSVAVAAGTGLLTNPFGGAEPGRPAATVSAAESPDRLIASPSPDVTRGGSFPSFGPDSATRGSTGRQGTGEGTADGRKVVPSGEALSPGAWRDVTSSCRDMRGGKELEADRRRALEKAAKGSTKVPQYCEDALKDEPAVRSNADTGTGTGTGAGREAPSGRTGADDGEDGKDNDPPGGNGNGNGNGNNGGGNGQGNRDGHRGGRAATQPTPTPAPTSFVALRADEPQPAPAPAADPSYGILPLPTAT